MAKDHFVPRFYLRNFQIPAEPGMIYQYRRKVAPAAVAIKTVCQEEDYYDLERDDPKTDKDMVDKLLGRTEKASAGTLQKLLTATSFNLPGKEKAYLSWFVAMLAARTPFTRNRFASLDMAIRERDIKKMVRDEKNIQEMLREYPQTTEEELRKAAQAFLDGDITLEFKRGGETEDFLMGHQIQFADNLVEILQRKNWNLIETNSVPFVTSDNPVVTMPSPYHYPGARCGFPDGDILLPLSPKKALWLTNRWFAQTVLTIVEEEMPKFQFYSITQCDTDVFSHANLDSVQQILDKTEYGHTYQVMLPPNDRPLIRKTMARLGVGRNGISE